MKVFITGICGFVGSALARRMKEADSASEVFGIDNLTRFGSEANRRLTKFDIRVAHGDTRCASDMEGSPSADWVVDAAANPSELAGVDGRVSPRQLIEHNLFGTVNTLEYCRRHGAGLILLSTSRVYSIRPLSQILIQVGWCAGKPLRYIGFGDKGLQVRDAFHPDDLSTLVLKQVQDSGSRAERIFNVGGGLSNSMSLLELSNWCKDRFGHREVLSDANERQFDIPWMVLDTSRAREQWSWKPARTISSILAEIADHAEKRPDWLELTSG